MSNDRPKIGETSAPRFEFRSFGQNFEVAAKRMARLSMPLPEKFWERYSDEIYIMSRSNDVNNTKIRDDKMDIKTLVQTVDGFEQWNPLMKGEFPMAAEKLRKEVFNAFRVPVPHLTKDEYSYEEFMSMIREHPDLQAVYVHKQRFGYLINDVICETGIVLINGARVETINLESTDVELMKQTIKELRLQGVENINYLQAIKRVIGMISKPLAN
jgi:hypothetical protein